MNKDVLKAGSRLICELPWTLKALFVGRAIDEQLDLGNDRKTTIQVRGKQITVVNGRVNVSPNATVRTFEINNVQVVEDEITLSEIDRLINEISTTELSTGDLPKLSRFIINHQASVGTGRSRYPSNAARNTTDIFVTDPTNFLGIDRGFIGTTENFDRFLSHAAEQNEFSHEERLALRGYTSLTQEARRNVSEIFNVLQGMWDSLALDHPAIFKALKRVPGSAGVLPSRFTKLFSPDQVDLVSRIDGVRSILAQEGEVEILKKVNAIRQTFDEATSTLFVNLNRKLNELLVSDSIAAMVKRAASYVESTGLFAGEARRDYSTEEATVGVEPGSCVH